MPVNRARARLCPATLCTQEFPHARAHRDMRPSTVSIRSSLAPGAQHPPSAENLAGLNQKKKESEAVDALQRYSVLFLQRLEGLADDCEAMADAGAGMWPFPSIP